MKTKTSELLGAALDWAVCAALEKQFNESRVVKICRVEATTPAWIERENAPGSAPHYHRFSPSTDRDQGYEIVEREGISIIRSDDDWGKDAQGYTNNVRIPVWCAERGQQSWSESTEHQQHDAMYQFYVDSLTHGPTALIAAMRCYVASKLGEEVEIPDELTGAAKPKTATQRYNECTFGVFGERLTDAEQQPGMLVRYGDGSTALAKLHSRHAGGWHGDQCMGGSTFIYGSIYKATALDHEIWNECAKWRKSR